MRRVRGGLVDSYVDQLKISRKSKVTFTMKKSFRKGRRCSEGLSLSEGTMCYSCE